MTEEDYPLATAHKRQTFIDNADGMLDFAGAFDADGARVSEMLRDFQQPDTASCAWLLADEKIVGSVMLALKPNNQGLVNNYYVLADWRGQRLGDRLDAYAMAFFRQHGSSKVFLKTNPLGGAVAFYQRLSWQELKIEPNGMMLMTKDLR